MFDLVNAMKTAASGMRSQGFRLRVVGENLANVDTPGFQRKTVSFESEFNRVTGATDVRLGPIRLDETELRQSYEPGHPLADERGLITYSNVNPLIEIADAREAQRSYQTNVSIFDQARQMNGSVLDLLRR